MKHSLQRPPYSVGVFDVSQVQVMFTLSQVQIICNALLAVPQILIKFFGVSESVVTTVQNKISFISRYTFLLTFRTVVLEM